MERKKLALLLGPKFLMGLVVAAGMISPGVVRAQDPTADGVRAPGITVYGTGEVAAKPDQVEIDLRVNGAAELTGDAIVKFRDAKKRTLDAFANLKLQNLVIEDLAMSVASRDPMNNYNRWGGMPPANPGKTKVEIGTTLRARLNGIQDLSDEQVMERIGRMLDAAKDSGATVGPVAPQNYNYYNQMPAANLTTFYLDNYKQRREEAYAGAVADARGRAERLAKLYGVKLGPVFSLREVEVAGDSPRGANPYPYAVQYGMPGVPSDSPGRISSTSFGKIPVRVKLLVCFSIQGPETKTAQVTR